MKKTLIALAVLAASGASFAQVTVTGKLGFSYQKNAVAAGGFANHGMAMADGDLNFTATEDLGAGMKITAKQAFASRGRDGSTAGRDASLQLVTGAGVFTLSAVESCSKIDNVAGAPVSLATAHDNASAPLDPCATLDNVAYNVPIGPVVIGLNYSDSIGAAGGGSGVATAAPFTATQITVAYAAGPLALGGDHTTFARDANPLWDGLSRTRLTAAYDLGVAKIGFGHQIKNHDVASQTTLSVNVPMGAADVGLTYATRAAQGANSFGVAVEDARTATAVGVKYALSKQTSVQASYGTYSNTAVLGNEYRIRLMKSF